jgi:hypothetical protein
MRHLDRQRQDKDEPADEWRPRDEAEPVQEAARERL